MKHFITWYATMFSQFRNKLFGVLALFWLGSSALVNHLSPEHGPLYAIATAVILVGFTVYVAVAKGNRG